MIPALACGNTVVLKPSEYSSLTSILIFEILEKEDFPKGSVNLVIGIGSALADALLKTDLIDIVSFTGSQQPEKSFEKKYHIQM